MPKQTFFNLPGEKSRRILEAAVDEFAEKGYKNATISGIVERAEIPKGSFYQYFEDKDDLYCYIVIKFIAESKLQTYEQEKKRLQDLNLTEFLRLVFRLQMENFLAQPRLFKIGMDMIQLIHEPVYERIMTPYKDRYQTYFLPFIQHEVDQGELDPQVNRKLLNFMLISLGQYIIAAYTSGDEITLDMIDTMVDDLDYILTNGIYRKAGD